jgi:hypothetical protein
MPLLSELPAEASKRDTVLDSANATAGPEQRKGMTTKERKAETAAATAAAIIGSMFSHTQTVTLGTATQFGGSQPAPQPVQPPRSSNDTGDDAKPDAPRADDPGPSNADLVPWIKLKEPPPPSP